VVHGVLRLPLAETNDLIYEGIATTSTNAKMFSTIFTRNKRPDLRRDCDREFIINVAFGIVALKQTTWFTKGLRRWSSSLHRFLLKKQKLETNDLIYEGIATAYALLDCGSESPMKQTTWFTKGLRRPCLLRPPMSWFWFDQRNKRPDLRRDCDTFPLPMP